MKEGRTAPRAARRPPSAMIATIVLAAMLVGLLVTLAMTLVRDFWVIVIAWMQP